MEIATTGIAGAAVLFGAAKVDQKVSQFSIRVEKLAQPKSRWPHVAAGILGFLLRHYSSKYKR